jgi:hypothetical protein
VITSRHRASDGPGRPRVTTCWITTAILATERVVGGVTRAQRADAAICRFRSESAFFLYRIVLPFAARKRGCQSEGRRRQAGLQLRGTDDKGVYVLVVNDRFVHE